MGKIVEPPDLDLTLSHGVGDLFYRKGEAAEVVLTSAKGWPQHQELEEEHKLTSSEAGIQVNCREKGNRAGSWDHW